MDVDELRSSIGRGRKGTPTAQGVHVFDGLRWERVKDADGKE